MAVKFTPSKESYARYAKAQIDHLRFAATAIEGGSIEGVDLTFVAAALRDAATRIKADRPRGRGNEPQFDHGGAALLFAFMTGVKGMSANAAHEELASQAGVSETAIKKALKGQGDDFIRSLANAKITKRSKT